MGVGPGCITCSHWQIGSRPIQCFYSSVRGSVPLHPHPAPLATPIPCAPSTVCPGAQGVPVTQIPVLDLNSEWSLEDLQVGLLPDPGHPSVAPSLPQPQPHGFPPLLSPLKPGPSGLLPNSGTSCPTLLPTCLCPLALACQAPTLGLPTPFCVASACRG